jgi:hypothetical protein
MTEFNLQKFKNILKTYYNSTQRAWEKYHKAEDIENMDRQLGRIAALKTVFGIIKHIEEYPDSEIVTALNREFPYMEDE